MLLEVENERLMQYIGTSQLCQIYLVYDSKKVTSHNFP